MNIDNIACLCGKEFDENNFTIHCRYCHLFLNKFTKFDFIVARLLADYLYNQENLFIIKFMLKRYLKLIGRKIKKYKADIKNSDRNKNIIANIHPNKYDENKKLVNSRKELTLYEGLFKDYINIDYSTPNPDINIEKIETLNDNINEGYNKNKISINFNNVDYYATPNQDINNTKKGVLVNNNNNQNNENENAINFNNVDYYTTPNPDINIEKNSAFINNGNNLNNENEISNNKNKINNNIFNYLVDCGKNFSSILLNCKSQNNQELIYSNSI